MWCWPTPRKVAGAEQELAKAADLLRASLLLADVAAEDGARHDPVRLARSAVAAAGRGVPGGVQHGHAPTARGFLGDRF